MKKKLAGSALCLILAAIVLAGCGAKTGPQATVRDVKVTVIVEILGDLSYNDGIVGELRNAEDRYRGSTDINLVINVYEMHSAPGEEGTEIEAALKEEGELVIIANQIALPVLEPAAAYHPDKKFILIDTEATGSNIYSAMFRPNEAAYLCGALAASISETGVVGVVIGIDAPALHDFCVGYVQGVHAVDPDCKVIISTVGSFTDEDMGYALAAAQFERNADVCFSVAGGAGLGCIKAAYDHDCYAIGVDIDQTEQVEPELRDTIITSCLKNFDFMIAAVLDDYLGGNLRFGESGHFGLKENAVGIARNSYYHDMVPQTVKEAIDELEESVMSGDIRVRSAYEMTRYEIDELFKSAKP